MCLNADLKSILIKDPSGNTWLMDGAGNINVTAPQNFTINAQNISFNASQNVNTTAGMNIQQLASMNIFLESALALKKIVGTDYILEAGNIEEYAMGHKKTQAEHLEENTEKSHIRATENSEVHIEEEFKKNSGNKTQIS